MMSKHRVLYSGNIIPIKPCVTCAAHEYASFSVKWEHNDENTLFFPLPPSSSSCSEEECTLSSRGCLYVKQYGLPENGKHG